MKRWPADLRERVLEWILGSPERGPSAAQRHFAAESMEVCGKLIPISTIDGWQKRAKRGPPPSMTAEGQKAARERRKAELQVHAGGKASTPAKGAVGEVVQGPQPAMQPGVDGLDDDLFSEDPMVRQRAYIRTIGQDLVRARIDRQGNVVSKLLAQMHDAQRELDEMLESAKDRTGDLEAMPEEEYIERLREVAADMPDPYLEVHVREYMRRHGLRLISGRG